jgi:HSP20 family protein
MKIENRRVGIRVGAGEHDAPGAEQGSHTAAVERQETFTPPIDIHEGPEGLTLEADLPGAKESSLYIELEDNVLTLHAKIDSPLPDGARLVHEEYRLGDFRRSFILSDEVDRDRITAEIQHGVLRLFLPKAERARTRRIEIKS